MAQQPYFPPSPSSPNRLKRSTRQRSVSPDADQLPKVHLGRAMSAAEVAKSIRHFETWASHQSCEQVAISDLPSELAEEVAFVFNLNERIPISWISDVFDSQGLSASLKEFLRGAHKSRPDLFSDSIYYNASETNVLFDELTTVKLAWNKLQAMRRSGEKWSEADFAANVYNVFRAPTIHRSSYRYQRSISLPQPFQQPSEEAARALHPKNAIPDCAIFVRASTIRSLSHSLHSPFKTLNNHPSVTQHARARLEQAFRYQSTPCTQPPETASFEFMSSLWEDKKPSHEFLEQAYRQNRLSTATAARMLYSLRIFTCVFGLVWADGIVRAHVDWCSDTQRDQPTIFSAPYSGQDNSDESLFHEWQLDRPDGILQVYFLLRNIDVWTSTRFREQIIAGVNAFCQDVVQGSQQYNPWKRISDMRLATITEGKENNPLSGFQRAGGSGARRGRIGRP
ncbi:hypothetical protein Clacol_004135 [Clathrus columnatus]|uniref:Uncharacterized protein n=1 Tax=Clathrus columnatus TaxID=1419009 RepID=A0AAV5AA77_9AGAM|nr:hypothetical protein Clacol_004135 [Clathrus columnatus]